MTWEKKIIFLLNQINIYSKISSSKITILFYELIYFIGSYKSNMTNYTNSSNSSCWFEYQSGKSKFGNTLTGKILQAGVQVNHWFQNNLLLYINILYLIVLIFAFYKKFIRGYVWVYIWKWFELGYQLFNFFRCALIIIIINVASKIKLTKNVLPHIIIYFIKMVFYHIISWTISVRFRVYSSSITKAAFAFEKAESFLAPLLLL